MASVRNNVLELNSNEGAVVEDVVFLRGRIVDGTLFLDTEPVDNLLERLKQYLQINSDDDDALLLAIIADCKLEIENYCHIDYNDRLDHALLCMCVFRYNKLGAEGIESENYSSIGFHYMTDYPDFILRELKSQRKIRTLA